MVKWKKIKMNSLLFYIQIKSNMFAYYFSM